MAGTTRRMLMCAALISLIAAFLTSTERAAAKADPTFAISPTAGPAGTIVRPIAADPCPPPADGDQPTAAIYLQSPFGSIGSGGDVDSDGNWDLSSFSGDEVPVGDPLGSPRLPPGTYTITARCFVFVGTTAQVYQTYADQTFAVTAGGLRLTVAPAPASPGDDVAVAPISACPAGSTGVNVFITTATTSNGYFNAKVPASGQWRPVTAKALKTVGTQWANAYCVKGAGDRVARYLAKPFNVAKPTRRLGNYVALGDSYSSGEGNRPFDDGTAVDGNTCHRSEFAWPRFIGVPPKWHLACSGAVVDDLAEGQQDLPPDNVGQIPRLRGIERRLSDDQQHVKTVTLTIGGNDIGFATIVRTCYLAECLAHPERLDRVVADLEPRVVSKLADIANAAPRADVFLVGYPRLFPATQRENKTCGWMTPTERIRANTLSVNLDLMLRNAAGAVGVQFVSVLDALDGHELCTEDSWMFEMNPALYGRDQRQVHPLGPGQIAIARIVDRRLEG